MRKGEMNVIWGVTCLPTLPTTPPTASVLTKAVLLGQASVSNHVEV